MHNNNPSFEFNSQRTEESKDGIFIERMYIRICEGDHISAILLSQIIYWFSKNRKGITRAKAEYNGRLCIIKQRSDWMEECEISQRQYHRACTYLIKRGFIETEVHKSDLYNNERAIHIFLNPDKINEAINAYTNKQIEFNTCEGTLEKCETQLSKVAHRNLTQEKQSCETQLSIYKVTETTTETTAAAVFGNLDLKKDSQEFLLRMYSPEIIKLAISHVTSPKFVLKKNLEAALKWACQVKPWLDKNVSGQKEGKKNIERNLEALMGFEEFFKREKSEAIFPLPKGEVILDLTLPVKEFSRLFEQLLKTHFITSVG